MISTWFPREQGRVDVLERVISIHGAEILRFERGLVDSSVETRCAYILEVPIISAPERDSNPVVGPAHDGKIRVVGDRDLLAEIFLARNLLKIRWIRNGKIALTLCR
jgi:hypothetical protein